MNEANVQWVVVTDLDGTLLNHYSYDYAGALEAIHVFQQHRIPIVFNTSKTFSESRAYQQALDISAPFIVENGSCIFLPTSQFPHAPANANTRNGYWAVMMGKTHNEICQMLAEIETPASNYQRLSQCSVEQAIDMTGLSKEQAVKAIEREYSEPLIWQADNEALVSFKQQLKTRGLTTEQGGRFLHVLGDCDKGRSMQALATCFDKKVRFIVLGDSANDASMLAIADIPVIVKSPSNDVLKKQFAGAIQTEKEAPQGWTEAIDAAIRQISGEADE